uniref:hypothetical protein n=1 Tax=Corynebacterium striatum TaxID=43770 RepID=UPI0006686313
SASTNSARTASRVGRHTATCTSSTEGSNTGAAKCTGCSWHNFTAKGTNSASSTTVECGYAAATNSACTACTAGR